MSVSPISGNNVVSNPAQVGPQAKMDNRSTTQASQAAQQPVRGPTTDKVTISPQASDGDSPAIEAAESQATKRAEKANNGFAPKANTGFHKIV